MQELLISPLRLEPETSLPLPLKLFGPHRPNSAGLDLTVPLMRAPLLQAFDQVHVPQAAVFDATYESTFHSTAIVHTRLNPIIHFKTATSVIVGANPVTELKHPAAPGPQPRLVHQAPRQTSAAQRISGYQR